MRVVINGDVCEPTSERSHTLDHDIYVQNVLEDAGITQLLQQVREDSTEAERRDLAQATLVKIAEAGAGPLLAGLFQPVDKPWTVAWAKQAAPWIGADTDPHRRAAYILRTLEGIGDFFVVGLRSSRTFHSYFAALRRLIG